MKKDYIPFVLVIFAIILAISFIIAFTGFDKDTYFELPDHEVIYIDEYVDYNISLLNEDGNVIESVSRRQKRNEDGAMMITRILDAEKLNSTYLKINANSKNDINTIVQYNCMIAVYEERVLPNSEDEK